MQSGTPTHKHAHAPASAPAPGLGLKDGQLSQLLQGGGGNDLESNPAARPQGRGRAARVLGIVPLRIVLVCLYLLVLHITVMVSAEYFGDLCARAITHRSGPRGKPKRDAGSLAWSLAKSAYQHTLVTLARACFGTINH